MLGLLFTKHSVAAEVKQHRSCYKKYSFNKPAPIARTEPEEILEEDENNFYSKTEDIVIK